MCDASKEKRVEQLTLKLIEGELSQAEEDELESVLDSDCACEEIYLELLQQEAALRSTPSDLDVAPGVMQRLRALHDDHMASAVVDRIQQWERAAPGPPKSQDPEDSLGYRFAPALFELLDISMLRTVAASLLVHLTVITSFIVYPFEVRRLPDEMFEKPDRFTVLILHPPKLTRQHQELLASIQRKMKGMTSGAETAKGEKLVGQIKGKSKTGTRGSIREGKRAENGTFVVASDSQRRAAMRKKFEQAFGAGGRSALSGGGGDSSLSGSLSDVIGTLGSGGSTAGLRGLGVRGVGSTGSGGRRLSGNAAGSLLGSGGVGHIGGGGREEGSRIGRGKKKSVRIDHGVGPLVSGALSGADIQKVIKQNRNQIRSCYELGLSRNPQLEGRIQLQWLINASGHVIEVKVLRSELGSKAVEQCIVAKLRTWKFPAPRGGGIVEVRYVFVFSEG